MRLRNLFTPSFRNRLRLFFMVIVIIPMIAVALVLFEMVSRSAGEPDRCAASEAQRVARNLYRRLRTARTRPGSEIVADDGLREAITDKDPARIQARIADAARAARARKALLSSTARGASSSDGARGGPRPQRAVDQDGKPLGRLVTAVETPRASPGLEDIAEVGVVILQGGEVMAARAGAARRGCPRAAGRRGRGPRRAGEQLRGRRVRRPSARHVARRCPSARGSGPSWLVLGALGGFLLLAFAFAITVSRTLQAEVQSLLEAARATRPRRLLQARADRGQRRVRGARQGVQLDGSGARGAARGAPARARAAGGGDPPRGRVVHQEPRSRRAARDRRADRRRRRRGRVRPRDDPPRRARTGCSEVAATGDPDAYERVLHAAEAAALDAGQIAEIELARRERARRAARRRRGRRPSASSPWPAATAASPRASTSCSPT